MTYVTTVEIEWRPGDEADPIADVRPTLEQMRASLGEGAHYHVVRLPRPLGTDAKQ